MALATGIGQRHPDLAVLNPSCCTTILPRHARRMRPFFEKPGFINDQDRLQLPQVLHQIGP